MLFAITTTKDTRVLEKENSKCYEVSIYTDNINMSLF